jgi:hypothetical protein
LGFIELSRSIQNRSSSVSEPHEFRLGPIKLKRFVNTQKRIHGSQLAIYGWLLSTQQKVKGQPGPNLKRFRPPNADAMDEWNVVNGLQFQMF